MRAHNIGPAGSTFPREDHTKVCDPRGHRLKADGTPKRRPLDNICHANGQLKLHHCDHDCVWPNCDEPVVVGVPLCKRHWHMCPRGIKDLLASAYRQGMHHHNDVYRQGWLAAFDVFLVWIATGAHNGSPTTTESGRDFVTKPGEDEFKHIGAQP